MPDWLIPAIASLENSQDLQDVEEEVQHGDKERDCYADGVRHGVGQVFGALHVIQDVRGENANAQDRDQEYKECTVEEDAYQTRYNQQNQAHEQEAAQV